MADSGKDLSTLGKHLSSLVNTFRRRTTEQHATSSKGVDGTRVDSTIGYQRWVGRPEEGVADVPEESVRLNLSPTTDDHDDANSTEGYEDDDDITSNATSEGEGTIGDADACSEQGSLSLQRAASLHSLEGAQEPATTKVDTIDEWQAGWNITNAIQVDETIPAILSPLSAISLTAVVQGGAQMLPSKAGFCLTLQCLGVK